jgi:hypothetical protein
LRVKKLSIGVLLRLVKKLVTTLGAAVEEV